MTDVADLGFKVDTSGLKRAEQDLDSLDKKGSQTKEKLGKAFKIGAAAALALGVAVTKTLSKLDDIGKTADSIGLSTSALQELRHAADLSGVSTEGLDKSMEFLSRGMGDAVLGTGKLKDVLEQYGLSLTNADGSIKTSEALLGELADTYQATTSQAEKSLIATAAFGRSGVEMGNLIKEGSAGVAALRAELTTVIPESAIRNAESANDAMTNLTSSMSNTAGTIIAKLAPAIEAMAKFIGGIPDFLAKLSLALSDTATDLTDFTKAIINMGVDGIDAITGFVSDFVQAGEDLIQGLMDGIANKLRAVKDTVTGAADSVLGWFKDVFEIQSPSKAMYEMGEFLNEGLADGITESSGQVFDASVGVAEGALDSFGETFTSGLEGIFKNVLGGGSFSGSIKGLFKSAGTQIAGNVTTSISKQLATAVAGSAIGKAVTGGVSKLFGASTSTGFGGAQFAGTSTTGAGFSAPASSGISGGTLGAAGILGGLAIAKIATDMRKARNEASVTAEFLNSELTGAFSTTQANFLGMSDSMTGFAISTGEAGAFLASAFSGANIEVSRGQNGLLKLEGNMKDIKAVTLAFTDSAVAGMKDTANAIADMGGASDKGKRSIDSMATANRISGELFGESIVQVNGLTSALNEIPSNIETVYTFKGETVGNFPDGAGNSSVSTVSSGTQNITVPFESQKASGGMVGGPEVILAGEQGRELILPNPVTEFFARNGIPVNSGGGAGVEIRLDTLISQNTALMSRVASVEGAIVLLDSTNQDGHADTKKQLQANVA